jgi:hypothetical protein
VMGGKHKIRELWSRPPWTKSKTLSKITREKRAGGMAWVIECLPSKHKALSSNLSTTKGRRTGSMSCRRKPKIPSNGHE